MEDRTGQSVASAAVSVVSAALSWTEHNISLIAGTVAIVAGLFSILASWETIRYRRKASKKLDQQKGANEESD